MKMQDDMARHAYHYLAAILLIILCVVLATHEPTWQTVHTYHGTGSTTTPTFAQHDTYWQLHWPCDSYANGQLVIAVAGDPSVGGVVVDETCHNPTTHGEMYAFDNGDNLSFTVTAPPGVSWTLQVQALR